MNLLGSLAGDRVAADPAYEEQAVGAGELLRDGGDRVHLPQDGLDLLGEGTQLLDDALAVGDGQ